MGVVGRAWLFFRLSTFPHEERLWFSLYSSNFEPFSSNGTHTLMAKIQQHTKKIYFCGYDKKIIIILIQSNQIAIVLAVMIS